MFVCLNEIEKFAEVQQSEYNEVEDATSDSIKVGFWRFHIGSFNTACSPHGSVDEHNVHNKDHHEMNGQKGESSQ
jgi:hypothetical protein